MSLSVTDYHELLALHKALMAAKFADVPSDPIVRGSPLLARVAERVIDAIREAESAQGKADAGSRWNAWREIDLSRFEWSVATRAAAEAAPWKEWSDEQRREYARILVAPLRLTPDTEELFLRATEQLRAEMRDTYELAEEEILDRRLLEVFYGKAGGEDEFDENVIDRVLAQGHVSRSPVVGGIEWVKTVVRGLSEEERAQVRRRITLRLRGVLHRL